MWKVFKVFLRLKKEELIDWCRECVPGILLAILYIILGLVGALVAFYGVGRLYFYFTLQNESIYDMIAIGTVITMSLVILFLVGEGALKGLKWFYRLITSNWVEAKWIVSQSEEK